MGRRILNRKELRADFDEAERRQQPEGEPGAEDEAEEEEEEEADGEAGEADGEEDDEGVATKKKKPAAKVKAKPRAKPRTRTVKVTRMRVVWGVYNNSNQLVTTYEYPKKEDAVAHAARLTADKKSTHFVQPIKEAIEEKKD